MASQFSVILSLGGLKEVMQFTSTHLALYFTSAAIAAEQDDAKGDSQMSCYRRLGAASDGRARWPPARQAAQDRDSSSKDGNRQPSLGALGRSRNTDAAGVHASARAEGKGKGKGRRGSGKKVLLPPKGKRK
eukprot:TRINITY_DN106701_c0_g1_i1.p1 TRINITY_DN106701_c0_g1~~TRINITY_DN106701_c0_g1_i1.p1  ORF type:complete len:144 (+),score=21.22 TRINITY_DN106701_c0_g1_i1:37-432(+)